MPIWLRRTVRCVLIAVLTALSSPVLPAQTPGMQDTATVTSSPIGAPYHCCFDVTITNRHDSTVTISDVRLRIISGRGRFVDGASSSPTDWSIFQLPTTVTWLSNTAAAEVRSGRSLGGFHLCARDTGIVRLVWETRNLDGILSTDTLALVCGNGECDEAFFRPQPSASSCTYDIDLLAGNLLGRIVNDFHLRLLDPNASFSIVPTRLPAGWSRTQAFPDLLSFQTTTAGLQISGFAEGFRVLFNAIPDSVRVAWWSTSDGATLCADTVTLRCIPLTRRDTLRITRNDAAGLCCQDFRLLNTHLPGSVIDAFAVQITSPGGTIVADSFPPSGWTMRPFNPAHDSVAFAGTLISGDSVPFGSICFDNTHGTGDTVRYRWQTYAKGVPVTSGTGVMPCLRPLTVCDSIAVESVTGAGERCITLRVANRNSRSWGINRVAIGIGNDGTRRRIRSAQAPAQWQVERFTADSVIYAGGPLAAGAVAEPFTLCMSLGDTATRDPLRISWRTSSTLGDLCGDLIGVNVTDTSGCDSVRFGQSLLTDADRCCFEIGFANRNGRRLVLDSFALVVADPAIRIVSSRSPQIWHVTDDPAGHTVSFSGVSVPPGDSTPRFAICLDASTLTSAAVVPVLWQTFSKGNLLCSDTIPFTCASIGAAPCDTVPLLGSAPAADPGSCAYLFQLINRHTPAGGINALTFRIVGGSGGIAKASSSGAASAWSVASLTRNRVTFRGPMVSTSDSIATFIVVVDSSDGGPVIIEKCTLSDETAICCEQESLTCAPAGVPIPPDPAGFRLYQNVPNPFNGITSIRYDLLAPSAVTIVVSDIAGHEVRRVEGGREDAGTHDLRIDLSDLPSGFYFYTLQAGGRSLRYPDRMVLVK